MRPLLMIALLVALASCGRDAPPVTASSSQAPSQLAEVRIGDVVVHASVVQTSTLAAPVAQEYGLERSDRIAMLLVSARAADGNPAPAGVTVTATASPASGAPAAIDLREVRSGGFVDRVGTVGIAPPETIRFDVQVRYGAATSTIQFTRDFFPQ